MMKIRKRKPLDMLHGSIWNKLPLFAFLMLPILQLSVTLPEPEKQ